MTSLKVCAAPKIWSKYTTPNVKSVKEPVHFFLKVWNELNRLYLNETHNVGRTMPVGIILLLKKKYFFRVKQSNFENTPKKFIKLWGKALERSILVSILTNVGFSFFLSKENWIMSMLRWGKLLEKFFPHSKIFS